MEEIIDQIFGQIFDQDFWPGFLALDQNGDGTDGRDGRDGRTGGRTGRTDGRTDGTDGRDGRTDYSFTVPLGRRNTVYRTTGTEKYSITVLFTIHYSVSQKIQKPIFGTL